MFIRKVVLFVVPSSTNTVLSSYTKTFVRTLGLLLRQWRCVVELRLSSTHMPCSMPVMVASGASGLTIAFTGFSNSPRTKGSHLNGFQTLDLDGPSRSLSFMEVLSTLRARQCNRELLVSQLCPSQIGVFLIIVSVPWVCFGRG